MSGVKRGVRTYPKRLSGSYKKFDEALRSQKICVAVLFYCFVSLRVRRGAAAEISGTGAESTRLRAWQLLTQTLRKPP